jgi:hypothetical protein
MANNKPKIRINRKSIDELDTSTNKEASKLADSSKEESNPFTSPDLENEESSPFGSDHIESVNDSENPFNQIDAEIEIDEDEEPIDPDNPFGGDNYTSSNDNYSYTEPAYDPSSNSATPNVDLIIDPDMPYFFVFGNSTAGKSAMLSGLLYYIQTSRIGQLRSLGLNDQVHHRKGDYALNQMTKKVRNGEFIAGTQTLDTTEFVFPTEINLEFQPSGKADMPFCLLEMAGEDLREIELRDEGKSGGDFDARINAYLQHPNCNMKFICVVDVDTPENSENLINQFLRYAHKSGHTSNPVLITVNKWDKVADQYDNVKDYIEEKLPILTSNLFDDNRDMAYMKFSIGDVVSDSINGDSYKFQPEDSRKLLDWMYETATGLSLNEKVETSALSKFIKSIKNMFSNE